MNTPVFKPHSQTSVGTNMKIYDSIENINDGLPFGWKRRLNQRENGTVDWYVKNIEGNIFRSQKLLNVHTQEHGMQGLSLKPSLPKNKPTNEDNGAYIMDEYD